MINGLTLPLFLFFTADIKSFPCNERLNAAVQQTPISPVVPLPHRQEASREVCWLESRPLASAAVLGSAAGGGIS